MRLILVERYKWKQGRLQIEEVGLEDPVRNYKLVLNVILRFE